MPRQRLRVKRASSRAAAAQSGAIGVRAGVADATGDPIGMGTAEGVKRRASSLAPAPSAVATSRDASRGVTNSAAMNRGGMNPAGTNRAGTNRAGMNPAGTNPAGMNRVA